MGESFDDQLAQPTPAHSPLNVHAGSAVCIGLGSFQGDVSPEEEPPADALRDLPYARAVTKDLAAALADLGFSCSVYTETNLPTAPELGSCVSESLASATSGAHVVHVLSHGHPGNAGVYVVGADGRWDTSTRVESWVASVEDHPSRQPPHTLFVVDTCYSGQAARLGWLPAATEQTRAWVIAASAPDAPAFNGRLTRAVTTVLRKLKSGELDFSPSTYVPFVHLVEHVRREVVRLGGVSQYVTGTPVDGLFEPPLFANPRPALPGSSREALAEVDPFVSPFGDLDPALDPAHFLDRAAGHRDADIADPVGFFTGRLRQIEELARSLNSDHATGLTVVTGGAGSGKSALLGVLVCALHPRLREPTRHLWRQVPVPGSAWTGPLAAVHLRERTLDEATSALIRQLHLAVPSRATPRAVAQAVAALPEVPLVIFDALDEATEQDAVHRQLLHPLAAAQRPDGSPAAHLWVGTRPWRQFDDLLDDATAKGCLIDLDAVPIAQLRTDLHDYVDDILAHADTFQDRSTVPVRRRLAQGLAETLTAADRPRGGEFLISALYTHWLQRRGVPPGDPAAVTAMLAQVPADVPGVLDLDLSTREDQPWLAALLVTLAHAHGAGMPATVMRRAAGAFHPDAAPAEISVPDFDRLLQQVRFYLRSTPDSDGTSLYRLFHQSLVDHLNDPDADLSGLADRVMALVPTDERGRPRPEGAEPYIQRHWIQHAADAGRIDLLVNESPAELAPPLNIAARTRQGRLGAAIYRQSAHLYAFREAGNRCQLLSVDAARYRSSELTQRLAMAPSVSSMGLFPRWSTGGSTTPWMRALMTGHDGIITSVAMGQIEGRTIIVSGSYDKTVRVWDAHSGTLVGDPLTGHEGRVNSVAVAQVDGRTVIISGSDDHTIRRWDAATGSQIGAPITGHKDRVHTVAVAKVEGRALIISGSDDDTIRRWDAATGSQIGRRLGRVGQIASIALGQSPERAVIFARSWNETVRALDAVTGKRLGRFWAGGVELRSIAIGEAEGLFFVVSGSPDGTVRTNVPMGEPVGDPFADSLGSVEALTVGQASGHTIIVAGTSDGLIYVWDAAKHRPIGLPLGPVSGITSLVVGQADGRTTIVSGSTDGSVRIWELPTGIAVGAPVPGHSARVTSVAVGRMKGRTVVISGSLDETVRLWDAETGEPVGNPLFGHLHGVNSVAVGEIGGRTIIVSGSDDRTVRLWDAEDVNPIGRLISRQKSEVIGVAVCQIKGRTIIISAARDGLVQMWDAETAKPVHVSPFEHLGVNSVAAGEADGRTIIVSGSRDQSVQVWDAEIRDPANVSPFEHRELNPVTIGEAHRQTMIMHFTDHPHKVNSVAVGRTGGRTIIVSGSATGIMRVWHLTFHRRRLHDRTIHWHEPITAVALDSESTENRLTVALGHDDFFSVWHDAPDAQVGPSWKLPDAVTAVSHLPASGWVVAFGNEVACFDEVPGR